MFGRYNMLSLSKYNDRVNRAVGVMIEPKRDTLYGNLATESYKYKFVGFHAALFR